METQFEVQGMHCAACENRIKTALKTFPAIADMAVDHRRDLVTIEHHDADLEAVATAIAGLGFTVAEL